MTLLIDIGNTRIKLGYANAEGQRQTPHTVALAHSDLDQLLPWLKQHSLLPQRALGIYVSSNALAKRVEQQLALIGCVVHWLDATISCPLLQNTYERPELLGADRWLALIGILAQQQTHAKRPMVHASFGTATTVDTVLPATLNDIAQFIGGLILPGPKLMYDALTLNTAMLGKGIGAIESFPTNTRAAISSGVSAAQSGAVIRQWQLTWQKRYGTPILVCSGGGWELIQAEVTNAHAQQLSLLNLALEPVLWQPTPVLDGLSYMTTIYHPNH